MAKIKLYPLTFEMMQNAEEVCDKLRSSRFNNPSICHKCGSNHLQATMPQEDYVTYELIDGQWECVDVEAYGSADWDNAQYYCNDCGELFKPTNANGWAAEALAFEQRLKNEQGVEAKSRGKSLMRKIRKSKNKGKNG